MGSKTEDTIITCKCGDTEEFARNAYRILFKSDDYPKMINGRIVIKAYLPSFPPEYQDKVEALVRSKDKFAYLFSDTRGVWDLLKGVRVC